MSIWMIEGQWTGPINPAGNWTREVHREYTTEKSFVDEVQGLGSILYTDGTRLILKVSEVSKRELPRLNGYGSLIRECLAHKVNAVTDLPPD